MDEFEQYLQALKLRSSTVASHCYNVKVFTQWLETESHLDIASIGYNDLLAYVQHEKQKNASPATINLRLAYKRFCYYQLGKTAQYEAGTIYGWAQAYQ
jgi:site-specific recombinase XerD